MRLESFSCCAYSARSSASCYCSCSHRTYCKFGSLALAKRLRSPSEPLGRTKTRRLGGFATTATKRIPKTLKYAGSANMQGRKRRHLTIVGGDRDALAVWRLGRWGKVCALGACPTWSSGPSTSPLGDADGAT